MNEEWALPLLLPHRTIEEKSSDDGDATLSRRSEALGVVLTVLLVGLTACLLGLLLHKRERRWGHWCRSSAGKLTVLGLFWSSCCISRLLTESWWFRRSPAAAGGETKSPINTPRWVDWAASDCSGSSVLQDVGLRSASVNYFSQWSLNHLDTSCPQVNMDEEGGEEEMEWLMEELEAPQTSSSSSAQRGRSNHANGHITTKPVNTDGLRSFSLDEQDDDSEDEVLSVPGVRVVKSSGASRHSAAQRSAFLQVSFAFCISCVLPPPTNVSQQLLISGGERRGPGRPPGGVRQEEEEQEASLIRLSPW